MECPAISELLNEGEMSERVRGHVAHCPRCQALLRAAQPEPASAGPGPVDASVMAGSLAHSIRLRPVEDLEVGAVLAAEVEGEDERLLAAVLDQVDGQVSVAPISEQVEMATNWDLLLETAVLGYEAMVETWNRGELVTEQIVELYGGLDDAVVEWLVQLDESARQGIDTPQEAPVGPEVLSDTDPRLRFQEMENDRTLAFWGPATVVTGVESLGQLVRARTEELEVSKDALLEVLEEPHALAALEEDQLDIEGTVPVAAMAALMRALEIPLYQRVRHFVHGAVAASCQDYEQGVVLARRRRGSRVPQPRPSEEECQRRAEAYVEKLAAELADR